MPSGPPMPAVYPWATGRAGGRGSSTCRRPSPRRLLLSKRRACPWARGAPAAGASGGRGRAAPVARPRSPPPADVSGLSVGARARLRREQAAAAAAPPPAAPSPPPADTSGLSVGARARLRREQQQAAAAAPTPYQAPAAPVPPPAPYQAPVAPPAAPLVDTAGLSVGARARLRKQQQQAAPAVVTPAEPPLSVGARARLRAEQQAQAAAPPVDRPYHPEPTRRRRPRRPPG